MEGLQRNRRNIKRARALRSAMSYSERVLWASIRGDQFGVRFRRQYPIGPFILDFYCPAAKLCVEVDGEIHATRLDRDAKRDVMLSESGILTYRIPSLELFDGFKYTPHFLELKRIALERAGLSPSS